jgi:signal transduction histidine kinase
MSKPLRLLLVEDSEDDAALVMRQLKRGGYRPQCSCVRTQGEFRAALGSSEWDVIISDYALPGYSGLMALDDLRASGKDIPFILVSGTLGDAEAVRAMKAGAQDYVLKGELTRLPMAVEREVREAAMRAEQMLMREHLVISERMASAGMLAAGVAHEINNPLAIAMTNLEFIADMVARAAAETRDPMQNQVPLSSWMGGSRLAALDEPMRDAREALIRLRDIVRDVKLFSRPHDEKTAAVDVRRVIDSSGRMAWNEIRHRARLVKDYQPVPLVNINESRLGQVLLNLIVNAAQAMPEGHADGNELRVATRTKEDGRAIVEISDTGIGIEKENLSRIFDPFFTTKQVGVGTGLGLSICHRLVSEVGGAIEVESEVGKGTLFRLLLPSATDSQSMRVTTVRPVPRHKVRVLAVDDEPAMGRALLRTLHEYMDVTALTSGDEVVKRIAAGERFDVILSDLMMPEMTGMELHERLARIAPDQADRMIFVTGGAFTKAARAFLDRVPNPRIEKPIEATNLLAMMAGLVSP